MLLSWAFFSRMAIRVSMSGGWMSAISTHSSGCGDDLQVRNVFRKLVAGHDDLLSGVVEVLNV